MYRKKFLFSLFIFVAIVLFGVLPASAQTGKIAGIIVDVDTGEPLAGANVVVEGLALGASADADGFFFILNLVPGTYSLTASYVGYQTTTQTEVAVSLNKTTNVDFAISSTTLETDAIVVVSERPVVKKDLTGSERLISSDDLARTWVRTVEDALETQPGYFQGRIRGGNLTETVYMMDNVSLNSGLLRDNYSGVNPSTIQEVNVLTGGYNAEYGQAMSGIVDVITKEATTGIHGTALIRMRPAGKYHYGRNVYSQENYDWTNFNLDYWTEQANDPGSEWFGEDPNALLSQWQTQITPDEVLADYADRMQWEGEATVYGALTQKLSFLISARFMQGVGTFPSQLDFYPEHNFQGKLSYKFTDAMKLTFNGIWGGYETASISSTNFNTTESAQEGAWYGFSIVAHPYYDIKYHQAGAFAQWPEERTVNNWALKWNHALSPKTFYEVNVAYLQDKTDKSDRNNLVPDDKYSFDDDEFGMIGFFLTDGFFQRHDKFESTSITVNADISSQVTKNHLLKGGLLFRTYDFSYDHAMMATEGGERWNLMNVFEGQPYEGAAYIQDKIEFSGLIVNAGLRIDFFNQDREAPNNMFDPLAYQETTDGNVTPGFPGNPVMVKSEMKVAVAPRLGISHPISENSVLHFVYGHFYQRPSWAKMFGFPYINFATDMNNVYNPYNSSANSYMDQWMGWYGNINLDYEKVVQYEIGLDQNIANIVRLDITGYYKDYSNLTTLREGTVLDGRWGEPSPWTTLFPWSHTTNVAVQISNNVFTDARGVEIELDTRFDFPLNFRANYDLSFVSGGASGFVNLWELDAEGVPAGLNTPQGYGQTKKTWNSNHKFKGWANLYFGPQYFTSLKPLNDVFWNLYFEYFTGPEYTYHGPGDTSTEPNNKRWEGHNRWNTKLAAGLQTWGFRTELALEVRNLFNNKTLNMLGGEDLVRYEEEGVLPNHWWSGEPDEWSWYDIWSNPPQEIFLQLRVDF
jgi:hypothetical protein